MLKYETRDLVKFKELLYKKTTPESSKEFVMKLKKVAKTSKQTKTKKEITSGTYFENISPEIKIEARQITYCEIRRGNIQKQHCMICRKKKVEAHHEDYSKPLEVMWLCTKHHGKRHKELNKMKSA